GAARRLLLPRRAGGEAPARRGRGARGRARPCVWAGQESLQALTTPNVTTRKQQGGSAMNRREFLRTSALGALALAAGGPALAQGKMVMKASDVHPAGYPTVVAVENIGKKLDKATNGRLTVQMFASMQLGGEKEAIEQAQVGAIQFARVSVGALGPVVDELNVFNLPYVFRNTEHMQKVIDGPIGQDLLDKVTNSGKGLVGLAWMDAGARNFYNTKKPIKTMADLK